MKKFLALMLVLAMTVCAFTACTDSKKEDGEDTKEKTESTESKESTKSSEVSSVSSSNSTVGSSKEDAESKINAYIDSQRSDLDAMIDTYEEMGIYMDVYAEGSAMVYECVMDIEVPASQVSVIADAIKSELSGFSSVSSAIFDECSYVESVVVKYYDKNNTLLYSESFSR